MLFQPQRGLRRARTGSKGGDRHDLARNFLAVVEDGALALYYARVATVLRELVVQG